MALGSNSAPGPNLFQAVFHAGPPRDRTLIYVLAVVSFHTINTEGYGSSSFQVPAEGTTAEDQVIPGRVVNLCIRISSRRSLRRF